MHSPTNHSAAGAVADLAWCTGYASEERSILRALWHLVVRIEPVGSTDTPGIGVPSSIGIMVSLRDLAEVEQCLEPLQRLGYEHIFSQPDWSQFRRPGYTLDIYACGSERWERQRVLRDSCAHIRS